MTATATITSRGQVTIPRKIREFLHAAVVQFEIVDETVVVRPIRSVGGRLAAYASRRTAPWESVRDQVWKEAVRDKVRNTPA
jgi:bifunctional DNA-binding transcriptional regulator/antitoxin component of YhaV-PrlF toxin-antitoxin module